MCKVILIFVFFLIFWYSYDQAQYYIIIWTVVKCNINIFYSKLPRAVHPGNYYTLSSLCIVFAILEMITNFHRCYFWNILPSLLFWRLSLYTCIATSNINRIILSSRCYLDNCYNILSSLCRIKHSFIIRTPAHSTLLIIE